MLRKLSVGVSEFILAVVFSDLIIVRSFAVETGSREELPVGSRVRLVGGTDRLSGRLEVLTDGSWGTVCNTTFDYRAASVVCRQLGFVGGLSVHNRTIFGQGTGKVTLSESRCIGSEPSLSNCQLRLLRQETYLQSQTLKACANHLQDVGVICQNDSDVVKGIRLSGRNNDSGRLEVFIRGKWGVVCDRGFTYNAARVACIQLGLRSVFEPILFGHEVPRGLDLDITLADLRCTGNERFLQDCPIAYQLQPFCSKEHAVGVICESDPDTIFFAVMHPPLVATPNNTIKSFLVNSNERFYLEMFGGSGQILIMATITDWDGFLKIVLRKFINATSILGRSWITVEHTLWYCHGNESTCQKTASKLESVLGYREWTNYVVSLTSSGKVLHVESRQLGATSTLLSAPIPVSLGNSFRVLLGAGEESEVIYRVHRSQDVNRCYLRDEERSGLRSCGDPFVNSSLCIHCGCCFDQTLEPRCYLPLVTPSVVNERPCLRSLPEALGRVLVTSETAVCLGENMTLAVGLQSYHVSVAVSIDRGDGNFSEHQRPSRVTDLPGWITSRYEELAGSLQYWAFIDVVYDKAGQHSVRVSFNAHNMETYVSPAYVAIVESKNFSLCIVDDGPTYYLKDDISLFFLVENYGAQLDVSFEVQNPAGAVLQSQSLGTFSTSVPPWALKKLPNSTTECLADFKAGVFKIFAESVGKYVIKATANSSCSTNTSQATVEVLPRPRLHEVLGELQFIVDTSYNVKVPAVLVLVLDRLSRSPSLEVNFGDGSEVVVMTSPITGLRLPDFAAVKLSTRPQESMSWIVIKHRFLIAGWYRVEVIYSDSKWDFLTDSIRTRVEIRVDCQVELTFEGGGATKENATIYGRGQTVRLVAGLVHDCTTEKAVAEWSVQRVKEDASEKRVVDVNPLLKSSGLVLVAPSFTLEYGFYVFQLQVKIPLHAIHKNLTQELWVQIKPAPLKAEITQGITQVIEWLSNVTIDASKSRDPDVQGQQAFANLSFTWFCLRNNKKLSDPITEDDSCFVDSSVNRTFSGPTLQFNTTQLRLIHFPSLYTFHLLVNKSHSRLARARHFLTVAAKVVSRPPLAFAIATATPRNDSSEDLQYHLDVEPIVEVRCLRNCLMSEYSMAELELAATCQNCIPGEALSYKWSLVMLEGDNLTDVDWDVVSTNGNTESTINLVTSAIESPVSQLFITVSVSRELGETGEASFAIRLTPISSSLKVGASTSGGLSLKPCDSDFNKIPIVTCSAVLFSLEMIFLARFLPGRNLLDEF